MPGADDGHVKVECPSCSARYSLSEERVRGRVLKIRCKQCQHVFEVRSPDDPQDTLAERGRKQWFVAIARQRVGPMTAQELRDRYARSEIGPRTHCWRPQMAQWQRLQDISEFADLIKQAVKSEARAPRPTGGGPAVPGRSSSVDVGATTDGPTRVLDNADELARASEGQTAVVTYLPPDTQQEAVRLRYAETTPETTRRVPAPRAEEVARRPPSREVQRPRRPPSGQVARPDPSQKTHIHFKERDPLAGLTDTGDVLGIRPTEIGAKVEPQAARSLVEGESVDEPVTNDARHERRRHDGDDEEAGTRRAPLTAERHEGSVLFSLDHLLEGKPRYKPPQRVDEELPLPVLPVAAPVAPLVVSPVVAPVPRPKARRRGLWIVMILLLLLGGAAAYVILWMPHLLARVVGLFAGSADQPDQRPTRVESQRADQGAVRPAAAADAAARSLAPDARVRDRSSPRRPVLVVDARVRVVPDARVADSRAPEPVRGSRVALEGRKAGGQTKPKKPPPRKQPAAPNEDDDGDERPKVAKAKAKPKSDDDDDAKAGKKASDDEGAKTAALSRSQIAAGMRRAKAAVRNCRTEHDQTGTVTLQLTIDGSSGRIGRGEVIGSFAGTAIGTCVLQAARRHAEFPRFEGTVTVRFPFLLQ